MTIEQEIFQSYKVDIDTLEEYGFTNYNGFYTFSISFHNDEFEARITIDEKGILSSKVIEKAFEEEFSQLRIESFRGGYIGEIREEYKAILIDIRDHCYRKEVFVSNQANRVTKLIEERYKEYPDFPFDTSKYKNFGVFRYKPNNKWYGLIMNVSKSVFGGNKEEYVDVINVRIDETKREGIINNKNIYPSYHMNKKLWVSILLDESLPDEVVMGYIDYSRTYMMGKR